MTNNSDKINDLESALHIIMDAIVTQKLAPGEKVSENILSDKLGISRTISRNLIERLIAKHFLTTISQRVTQVSALTLLEIKQNFMLRKMLLPEVMGMAATNSNIDKASALNKKIEKLIHFKNDEEALQLLKMNKELNLLMCENAGYPLVLDWIEQLEDMAMRIYWLYIKSKNHFPYSSDQQNMILALIKNGDANPVKQAILEALTQTEDRILNAVFSNEQFYTQNLKV